MCSGNSIPSSGTPINSSHKEYLDLRKDTNNCCKISARNGADFLWRTWKWSFFAPFWPIVFFSGQKISGKRAVLSPGTGRFYTRADSTWLKHENMKSSESVFFLQWSLFFWNGQIFKNGRKSNQNLPWTEICNQWISRYR